MSGFSDLGLHNGQGHRVPHLRDGFIVATVGIRAKREPLPPIYNPPTRSVILSVAEGPRRS